MILWLCIISCLASVVSAACAVGMYLRLRVVTRYHGSTIQFTHGLAAGQEATIARYGEVPKV